MMMCVKNVEKKNTKGIMVNNMIEIDRVDRIIAKVKEKQAPDHITWRMEIDDEVREKIHAKRTTNY